MLRAGSMGMLPGVGSEVASGIADLHYNFAEVAGGLHVAQGSGKIMEGVNIVDGGLHSVLFESAVHVLELGS